MIWKLIWRNLWRNSRRTWITMASITFSILFAIVAQSLQRGVFNNLIKDVVNYYSGYIQVHRQGYWAEQTLENGFSESRALENRILKSGAVWSVTPRLETFMLASGGNLTKSCMLVGTDPLAENNLTQLKSRLVAGNYWEEKSDGVLLAQGLAEKLRLQLHDTLILFGQGFQGVLAAGRYPIVGIVKLAAPQMNNGMVFLPLTSARRLLNAENLITTLSLGIKNPENLNKSGEEIRRAIRGDYEVMTWEEMMPEISNHIEADGKYFFVFTGILYLIIGFGFLGTMLMMTAERRNEFGILIAIGLKKTHLGLMLIGETLLITLCATLLGIGLSLGIVVYLHHHPLRFSGELAAAYEQFGFAPIFPAAIDPSIFLNQTLVIFCLSVLIGLYPLYFVYQLDPVKAMKP